MKIPLSPGNINIGKDFSKDDFPKIYKENRQRIYNYVLARVNSKEDAEDLTEEIFVKVYKNLADFKWQGVSIRSWIYRISKNAIIDYYRKYSKEKDNVDIDLVKQKIPGTERDILLNLLDDEEKAMLYQAISSLKEQDQYLIYYKYFEDLSITEIAKRLNLSETNIGTRLHRLRKKLLTILKPEDLEK